MISEGRSARSEVPSDRFNIDAFYHPHNERGGTLNSRGGHFVQHMAIDAFDAPFFSITPNEAKAMDPQQRWALECTYEAIENGKSSPSSRSSTKLDLLHTLIRKNFQTNTYNKLACGWKSLLGRILLSM